MQSYIERVNQSRGYVWSVGTLTWIPQEPSAGGTGGTALADRATFTVGTTQATPIEGLYEAAPTTVADGQVGAVGMTTDRKLKVSGSFSSTPIVSPTGTLTNVADNAANVTVLTANAARLAFVLYNDSSSAVFVKLGATASATSFTKKMLPQEIWGTLDIGVNYSGKIDAIWVTAPGGFMRVTELT